MYRAAPKAEQPTRAERKKRRTCDPVVPAEAAPLGGLAGWRAIGFPWLPLGWDNVAHWETHAVTNLDGTFTDAYTG